jgi:hypothetical protein
VRAMPRYIRSSKWVLRQAANHGVATGLSYLAYNFIQNSSYTPHESSNGRWRDRSPPACGRFVALWESYERRRAKRGDENKSTVRTATGDRALFPR